MTYSLVIKHGQLITAHDSFLADLAIQGERIVAIGHDLSGEREIDAHGLYVLPGAIDGHVHLTDPTFAPLYTPTADSFSTGSIAAAMGGVTTLIDFAQPAQGMPLLEALDRRQEDADGQTVIDYALHLVVRDPDPARLDDIPAVFARGVPSFKFFMAYEGYQLDDVSLWRAMERVARQGGLAVVHAENYALIQELRRRLAAAGKTGPRWHVAACPSVMEGEAVHRAIALARLAGTRLLLYHQSCEEGVREIRAAKARGQTVFGEACVHYLVLTEEVVLQRDPLNAQALCVSPPIRDAAHQAALWRGLADGTLDIVSTDHNPRQPQGLQHPAGTSSIETRLALVHHFGVRTGRLTLNQWVQTCCTRPAEIFGLSRKGQLTPGYDADLVLFDPHREITFSPQTLHSPIAFCTYEGLRLVGFPVTTISRGEVIIENGRLVGQPGRGQFIERGQ